MGGSTAVILISISLIINEAKYIQHPFYFPIHCL